MAHILNQTVVQDNQNNLPKRIIIQWTDDVSGELEQKIVEYNDLTTEEKSTYDNFITLSENLMNV